MLNPRAALPDVAVVSRLSTAPQMDPRALLRTALPGPVPDVLAKAEDMLAPELPFRAAGSRAMTTDMMSEGLDKRREGRDLEALRVNAKRAAAAVSASRGQFLQAAGDSAAAEIKKARRAAETALAELAAAVGSASEVSDKIYDLRADALMRIARLEEVVAGPRQFEIPPEVAAAAPHPPLTQRAYVDIRVKPSAAAASDIPGAERGRDGKTTIKIRVAVDGINAPISAGNFVALVKDGFYDGREVTR